MKEEELDYLTEQLTDDFKESKKPNKWPKSGVSVKKLYEFLKRLPKWRRPF
jgi:hypothetical protein